MFNFSSTTFDNFSKIEEQKDDKQAKPTKAPEPAKKSESSKSPQKTENTQPPVNNNNIIDYRDTIFGTKIDLNMSSFVTYKGKKFND